MRVAKWGCSRRESQRRRHETHRGWNLTESHGGLAVACGRTCRCEPDYRKKTRSPDFFGTNGTRFASCHFRAQKSLELQGPPLPMALEMDFSPHQNHYVPPVLGSRNFFLRFRFRLLKSYGSGSGSRSISRPYNANFSKKFWKKSCLLLYIKSFVTRTKFLSFIKFIVKCEWKKCKMKEIKYIILYYLYLVPVPEPQFITVLVPLVKKLRFRFQNTASRAI